MDVFVIRNCFFVGLDEDLNAQSPPETQWLDAAARSVLQYALRHYLDRLETEVWWRRNGWKRQVPGLIGRRIEEVSDIH